VIRLIEQVKTDLAEVPQSLDNIKQFINDFEECVNNLRRVFEQCSNKNREGVLL